ncbi:MAG: SDR family oxidoreductase [Nitrospinae bacterium]|nr:SDR family oxidoreductase [Nitrospinota bacterium]
MDKKIAVVTGANRGIGLEICRQLASLGIKVILTARDVNKGKAAAKISAEGLEVVFHQLDITSQESMDALAGFIGKNYGRLDILVNNAAVSLDQAGPATAPAALAGLKATMETNVYGPYYLSLKLAPLMKKSGHGRIVNVSSGLGQLSEMGAGYESYRISKTALNAVTRIMAAQLAGDGTKVNCVCPGWVRTDMGGPEAPRSVVEGADTIVWLTTLPDNGPTGGFFRDRKSIPW